MRELKAIHGGVRPPAAEMDGQRHEGVGRETIERSSHRLRQGLRICADPLLEPGQMVVGSIQAVRVQRSQKRHQMTQCRARGA